MAPAAALLMAHLGSGSDPERAPGTPSRRMTAKRERQRGREEAVRRCAFLPPALLAPTVLASIENVKGVVERESERINRPCGVVVSAQRSCRLLNDAPLSPTSCRMLTKDTASGGMSWRIAPCSVRTSRGICGCLSPMSARSWNQARPRNRRSVSHAQHRRDTMPEQPFPLVKAEVFVSCTIRWAAETPRKAGWRWC